MTEAEQNALIDAWEDREKKGEKLPAADVRLPGRPASTAGPVLPAAPFHEWLRNRLRERIGQGSSHPTYDLARMCGVAERRLHDWFAVTEISESVVDRAVSGDGRWSLLDLYPDGPETKVDSHTRKAALASEFEARCARPGCEADRNGGRFCHEHAGEYARMRAELEADGALMSKNGGAPRSQSRRKTSSTPTCCSPYCWNPRSVGVRFCDDCLEAGASEDNLA